MTDVLLMLVWAGIVYYLGWSGHIGKPENKN